MNLVSLKDRLERMKKSAANMREKAKEGAELVGETVLGGVVAAGLGALDQAKGTVPTSSVSKIAYYGVGGVPVSALVGVVGKLAALGTMGSQFASRSASAFGQAGIDVGLYLGGREMWARHAAAATTTTTSTGT
jgi:hypothetical protein